MSGKPRRNHSRAFQAKVALDAIRGEKTLAELLNMGLWRAIKYEEVYLRAYETAGDARQRLGRFIEFYNARPRHAKPAACERHGTLT